MTLRRKMAYQAAATVAGLLLLGGASLWGLNGLRQDYGFALDGYRALRDLFEVGAHLSTAKALLDSDRRDAAGARRELEVAAGRSALVRGRGALDPAALAAVRDGLARARAEVARWEHDPSSTPPGESVDRVLAEIGSLAARIRAEAEARQRAAEARRRATIAATAAVGAVVVAGAVGLGAWQYRGVVRPLQRLGAGVRRVAAGQFAERIDTHDRSSLGPDEFVRLADDFNRMAAELDGFYRELEQKVAAKSKELVRSERLAGVGYLAAGVAHEINNPLSIIAGYAEYSLDQLRTKPGAPVADLEGSLRVICDEAFRCRDITARLLSLARPGDAERRVVSLGAVAAEVASAVGGLRQFADRKLVVRCDSSSDGLRVSAVEGEMKQVVMNLLLNALEAVSPGAGEVVVGVGRDGRSVVLKVSDNGRGMSPGALERAFEPFFTDKRGARPERPGTGLGLSITHAIVEAHGGEIAAHSDGPGRGSTFTVRLPALNEGGPA